MKKLRLWSGIFLFAMALPAFSQTWFTVVPAAQQGLNTSVVLPKGTTWRIGDYTNNKWTAPVTTTAATTTVIDYADGGAGHPPDPDPGFDKEFDVLETSAAQTVTVNGASETVPIAPPPPPSTFTLTFAGTSIPMAGPYGVGLVNLSSTQQAFLTWNTFISGVTVPTSATKAASGGTVYTLTVAGSNLASSSSMTIGTNTPCGTLSVQDSTGTEFYLTACLLSN
jgi:hypothetical protein